MCDLNKAILHTLRLSKTTDYREGEQVRSEYDQTTTVSVPFGWLVCLYACMLEFCRTLEIIARTLREVVCLFVCLFVWIKPELLYFAPCVWREVITPGNGCTRTQAQTTCVNQRQWHKPRTCQLMANTLQVDGLARITGLTQAPYKTHPQPPK